MMKLILLAVAFIALVQPSVQLECYKCRSDEYMSSKSEFNLLSKCDPDDQKKWEKVTVPSASLDACLKVVEKVGDKKYIVRTSGPSEDESLKKDVFTVYSCKTDLCNSGIAATATAFTVCLSALLALSHRL